VVRILEIGGPQWFVSLGGEDGGLGVQGGC
jgi:hypothetical protein